ncbi:Clavaminate synthase-like protein [Aureobasidium pullulans]|nr:Clavaminate synthase-like protein [Aureobasidium pullulans]
MTRTKKSAYKPGAKERADKAAAANPQSYNAPTTTEGGIPQWKLGKPKDFYDRFVSKRQPAVIQGKLEDLEFVTKNWSKVDYLRETAGDAPVKVEPMHKEKKRYGTDVERVDTTFGAFLDSLKEEKDEYDYLTTQYSDDEDDLDDDDEDDEDYDKEKEDQHNEIASGTFPQPIRALLTKEVPMRPEVMGNLVLQQMNIWLGKSKAGTSSGLHHDFHDNLYVLLKGRKRFVLYPPSAVHHLDTYGKVKKIHTNGLIAYKQPGEDEEDDDDEEANEADQIRADGLVERDAAALKVQALEEKLDKFEATGKTKGLDKVQKEYGEAVERLMKYQTADFGELGEDDFDEVSSEEEEDPEELKDQVLRDAPSKKRKADGELDGRDTKTAKAGAEDDQDSDANDDDSDADLLEALEKAQNGQLDDLGDDEDASDLDLMEALENAQGEDGPSEPLSFSQVSTQELHSHLGLTSPQKTSDALEKAGKPYIVDLKAGDMLYLPTSWFHEVTSFSDESDDNLHIALNYWFHPPDAALTKFEHPYSDITLWKFMEEKVKSAYNSLVENEDDDEEE